MDEYIDISRSIVRIPVNAINVDVGPVQKDQPLLSSKRRPYSLTNIEMVLE
jgi:hypothetical protein